ncbi:MAG TPA: hypothetical protein VEF55_09775 [Candidatus Binatia bacterium]|nr:hypothetical protein [Candidatus Binatia bacterium]
MSDNSWVLRGIDPDARQKAEEDAARLGVNIADYLTDLVVRRAVFDQLAASSEADETHSGSEEAAIFAPAPEFPEGFAVRQRLKALERRLSTAIGSLDGAIHGLDTSIVDVTSRVGEVEALAADTAHALGHTQQEVNNVVAGLQIHLAVVEDNLSTQQRRIDGAERSASILADAHEALKHAVAEDFAAFTHDTADRLNVSLAELREAADAAADQADAAVAHLVSELRGLRVSLEHRLEESAEDTRGRMHAAFADAADRMASLASRVTDNERFVSRTAEQLRAQMTDAEDGAQVALEETAQVLRAADAALAADLARASEEHYAALEAARSDLAAQVGELREEQVTHLARLKLVDVAVGNTINSIAEVRGTVENEVRGALQQAGADWDQRFDAITARVARGEQQTQHLHQRMSAEFDRIETSTFAALEKLRRDIGAGDAAVAQSINVALEEVRGDLAEVRNRAVNEVHLLREEHTGALARLTLLDTAVTRLEGASININARFDQLESASGEGDPELERRIAQLEHAAAKAETEQALAIVRADVASLVERLDILYADTALSDRLTALQRGLELYEAKAGDLNEGLQGVARMLNRVAAQSVETAQKSDERTHQVEVGLADLRLQVLSNTDASTTAAALQTLQERMTAFELRQGNALEALRADIARFVSDNDRRLEALENAPTPVVDQSDLTSEFETLRSRIEERVLGVELRSVRTLEQVVDTVALLEQRLLGREPDEEAAAQSA